MHCSNKGADLKIITLKERIEMNSFIRSFLLGTLIMAGVLPSVMLFATLGILAALLLA